MMSAPKLMNLIDEIVKRAVEYKTTDLGLSTLHAWIRFFFSLFAPHLIPFGNNKKWQARVEEDQRRLQNKKNIS
jgi:hypothetical protein